MPLNSSGFNRYEPPSPSLDSDDNNGENSLKDLDKLDEQLPQPFRRINKILWEIFDQAWMLIEKSEQEREYKQSTKSELEKVLYEEELIIRDRINCLIACDGFVFLGLTSQISVYEIPSLSKIADFDCFLEESATNISIDSITILSNSDDLVLLLVCNEKGWMTVIGFKSDSFFTIEILNQQSEDKQSDVFAERFCLSEDNSYLAVSWTDKAKCKQWLDVYKLPIEVWMVETAKAKSLKANLEETLTKDEETLEGKNSAESGQNDADQVSPVPSESAMSFTKMQHILYIHPPCVKPNNNVNFTSLFKSLDSENVLIGAGNHHILSSTFFDNLHKEFKMKIKGSDDVDLNSRLPTSGTAHFLKGQMVGGLFSSPNNSRGEEATFNAVAVWWENHNQVSLYALKVAKDPEQPPFSILPHSNSIKLSAVNATTDLIAVCLRDHCISVWNRYLGLPLKVFMPIENQEVTMLRFSNVYHGNLQSRLTYATSNGKVCQMTCEKLTMTEPTLLDDRSSTMFEHDQVLRTIKGPMNLLTVIWKSGRIVVYNEASAKVLCEFELFNEQTDVEFHGSKLNVAFTKRNILASRDESQEKDKTQSRLFLFDPDVHPILQPFFHIFFETEEEEEEKGDDLEKYFCNFMREMKSSEESLKTRLATYRREAKSAK